MLSAPSTPRRPGARPRARATSAATRDAPPALAAFELAGRRCRIVCVDDMLPQHQAAGGSQRVRQRYHADEVTHFQLDGHRYALVLESTPADAAADGDDDASPPHMHLTNRELQIVQLICNGLLTKQVSDRLRLSEFTVRSYLKTIYCKLGVRSRGAMVYAYARSFSRTRPDEGTEDDDGSQ